MSRSNRSRKILNAALGVEVAQNAESGDDFEVSLQSNRLLGESTNTINLTDPLEQDVEDLITLSDIEESNCDDSVVDPNFIPDIISGTDSSDDEYQSFNLRKLLSIQRKPLASETASTSRATTTRNCNTADFIAIYGGPIIIADNYNSEFDYQIVPEPTTTSDITTQDLTVNKQKLKHPMLTKICKCTRECQKFTYQERHDIWSKYWDLKPKSRRAFLTQCITVNTVKRRKTRQDSDVHFRNESRFFTLPRNVDGIKIRITVCRQFILSTLGYTNDSVITELSRALKRGELVIEERRRGGRTQIQRDVIEDHIMSYHPLQSHYRRHNAPNTRYLPRHLTVKDMYADFKSKNLNTQCGVETYRKTMKNLKISLFMPKSDACVDCQIHNDIMANYDDVSLIPEELKKCYDDHKTKAELAVNMYRLEAQHNNSIHTKYFSMDMQKVILLPEMPQIKESHFVSRLITFNLTFAPIQKNSSDDAVCVLWHEAIAGREANNIVDAIWAFIDSERDVCNFHLWADNCTAQNKNWYLYTAMVMILNSPQNEIKSITISYLTKGHTHMSADSVHGNIDRKMTRKQSVYDFEDFKRIVLQARSKIKVVEPNVHYDWPKKKRSPRVNNDPLKDFQLSSIVQVKFVKGSRHMLYKTSFSDNFVSLDFILKKFDVTVWPKTINGPRGIKTSKKEEIITKLVHLMPESRKVFWQSLPVNDKSPDLVDEDSE